jgi:hypothetical protein
MTRGRVPPPTHPCGIPTARPSRADLFGSLHTPNAAPLPVRGVTLARDSRDTLCNHTQQHTYITKYLTPDTPTPVTSTLVTQSLFSLQSLSCILNRSLIFCSTLLLLCCPALSLAACCADPAWTDASAPLHWPRGSDRRSPPNHEPARNRIDRPAHGHAVRHLEYLSLTMASPATRLHRNHPFSSPAHRRTAHWRRPALDRRHHIPKRRRNDAQSCGSGRAASPCGRRTDRPTRV